MTDAYRLFEEPGLVADRYGTAAVIYRYEGWCTVSEEEIRRRAEGFGLKSVWLKEFFIDRNKNLPRTTLLWGEPEETVIATENGLRYEIRPQEGYSPGLFLDQTANRRFLRGRAAGKTVFNGFAYTCGFSVACAAGGASEVVSVDLSKNYLEWGKRNFLLNHLSLEKHRFFARDIFSFARKAGQWDLVILDPPSFSRSKETGTFSLKQDLKKVIALGAALTRPGGEFFFSCNLAELTSEKLKDSLETDRPIQWMELPQSPLAQFLVKL